MISEVTYTGQLNNKCVHQKSQTTILTDAPTDNQGLGNSFSPTDLVATALGSCILTIMGIAARNHAINIIGAKAEVVKIMASDPRRIAAIDIKLIMPKADYSNKEKTILEKAAHHCPVARSLHPDLKETIEIIWSS